MTDAPVIEALAAHARALTETTERAVLGVTGPPGCGKTTLVQALLEQLRASDPATWVAHVPMDGFHLADVALRRLGLLHRKGAPETFDVDGYHALLRRLRFEGGTIYAPMFERQLEQPLAGAIAVPPSARLVITEGNYLLDWPEVRFELDEVWFCDLPPDVRRARLLARHVDFGKPPEQAAAWIAAVDDPNAALVEATRHRADLVVPAAVLDELAPG